MIHAASHPISHVPGDHPDDIDDPYHRHVPAHSWRIFRRRFWQIVFFVLLLLPPLWLHLLGQPFLYKATASLLIGRSDTNTNNSDGSLALDPAIGENFSTQLHLLRGSVLIEKVIAQENLVASSLVDDLLPLQKQIHPILAKILEKVGIPQRNIAIPTDPKEHKEWVLAALIKDIRSHLRVQPMENSTMVEISYLSRYPELAARIVNAIAKNHIEGQMETRTTKMKQVARLLVQRLDELLENLERAETALETFRKQSGLITSEEKQSIEWQQLQVANDEYSVTIEKTMALQNQIHKLEDWIESRNNRRPDTLELKPDIEASTLLSDLYDNASQQEKLISRLTQRNQEANLPLIRLRKDFTEMIAAIHAEENRLLTTHRQQLGLTQKTLAKIETRLVQYQKKFNEYKNKAAQLRKLEREVEAYRELHNIFLKRFKETNIMGAMDIPTIQLIDAAEPPTQIDQPKMGEATLWTVCAGFIVITLLAFLFEFLDPTVKTPYEIERAIDLPLMGWVPLIAERNPKKVQGQLHACTPGTPYGEALQGIRTSLMMIDAHAPVQSIMIVSCQPQEGRTTLVNGLAKICSSNGERVLVIDADFRQHVGTPETQEREDTGISGIIRRCSILGDATPSPSLPTDIAPSLRQIIMERIKQSPDGYSVLEAGLSHTNPPKILSSPFWPAIMAALRGEFDRILVDSPPMLRFTDAQLLGIHMEAIILLVRSASTHKEHVATARKRMILSRTPAAGVILTQLDMRKHRAELREYGLS
ncbi:MAG: polysaccharide biosynthesis tyrosine autokinase [Nitrospirae bacterium]|nr:polysaccharide biosynthesis tyrosine autokinase [Magnetococcales bacterium]HAT49768.1 hypothetical protein [Alphaproteobacteria bacterium]